MNQTSISASSSIVLPRRSIREMALKTAPPTPLLKARPAVQSLPRLVSDTRKNQRAEEVIWLLLAASTAALIVLSLWI
jgi:hypothetical protein